MHKRISVLAALVVAAVVGQLQTATVKADDKPAMGTLKGVVKYGGDMAKANKEDKTDKDKEACGDHRTKPELIVDAATKGLADAVVFVKKFEKGTFTDAQKNVVLDQKSCAITPHVTLVAEGGTVTFKNSDTVLHNISYSSTNNGTFNQGIGAGKEEKRKFEKAEFVTLACSVHPWMSGLVVVMQNPYYVVSGTDGTFSLELPAGKHTILVQHQSLGKADKKGEEIEIKAGATVEKTFEYK